MANSNVHRLLIRDEVAERFGITKRFLETAASSGAGPKLVRIDRNVRYREFDIIEFIENCLEDSVKR